MFENMLNYSELPNSFIPETLNTEIAKEINS